MAVEEVYVLVGVVCRAGAGPAGLGVSLGLFARLWLIVRFGAYNWIQSKVVEGSILGLLDTVCQLTLLATRQRLRNVDAQGEST
jgi:hypothetical protein